MIDSQPGDECNSASESAHSYQARPTSLDYYLRLAEKRIGALSPRESVSSPPERHNSIIGKQSLQALAEHRQRDHPGAALALFSSEHWKSVLQIWAEEVGQQYPFIDTAQLSLDIDSASHDAYRQDSPAQNAPQKHRTTALSKDHRRYVEDTAILILMVVCMTVDSALIITANPLAEEIYRDVLIRTHLSDVNRADVSVMAVAVCSHPAYTVAFFPHLEFYADTLLRQVTFS